MALRYCHIAVFQGFRVAIPGLESGLKNSRRGGGEMAVSGCLSAAINLPPETIFNMRFSIAAEHDLFGKPASTFPDHAQAGASRRCGRVGKR
jgi:hypothetical protein